MVRKRGEKKEKRDNLSSRELTQYRVKDEEIRSQGNSLSRWLLVFSPRLIHEPL